MNTTTRPTRAPAPDQQRANTLPAEVDRMADATRAMIEQRTAAPVTRQTVMAPAAPPTKAYPPKIAKAILTVTRALNPVAKAGWNDFHKYAYRKFEDVFEELVPALNDAGLIIQQNEINLGNLQDQMISITYDFTIINEDGDVWPDRPQITAICKAVDTKGVRDDKAASKCNTQAQKYFYTSFFKIRTVETSEADADSGPRPQQKRRAVPSPDGKVAPHSIAIIQDEAPEDWAKRFKTFLAKAATVEEVDAWYAENKRVFERLEKKEEYKPVLDGLIDAMDARVLVIGAPAQQETKPQEQQKVAAKADSGFPGDTPLANRAQPDIDIPINLDRQLTEQEKDWLLQITEAYEQCNDVSELAAEQESIMLPSKDSVSDHAWHRANKLTFEHTKRVRHG